MQQIARQNAFLSIYFLLSMLSGKNFDNRAVTKLSTGLAGTPSLVLAPLYTEAQEGLTNTIFL